jgi:hypothetical protein
MAVLFLIELSLTKALCPGVNKEIACPGKTGLPFSKSGFTKSTVLIFPPLSKLGSNAVSISRPGIVYTLAAEEVILSPGVTRPISIERHSTKEISFFLFFIYIHPFQLYTFSVVIFKDTAHKIIELI